MNLSIKNNIFTLSLILIILQIATVFTFADQKSEINLLKNITNKQELPQTHNINKLSSQDRINGTQGYYLSPHAMGKQYEVANALKNIVSNITVSRTEYNRSDSKYSLDNFTIQLDYNDGKQNISIGDDQTVNVTGGTIQFIYRFNYSISSSSRNVKGWGHGSVYSDSLIYQKTLLYNSNSQLEWALTKNKGYTNLTIKDKMKIKRLQPYSQIDFDAISQMLDQATQNISPSNIAFQLLEKFNSIFPQALNDSLNHEVFGQQINYSFQHYSRGQFNATFIHNPQNFAIDKVNGFRVFYNTEIKGRENQTTCKQSILPFSPHDFKIYGGVQNIHLNCLYQDVLNYIQSRGWIDTELNSVWEVNAFQFFAGDLFGFMNTLYTRVSPVSILEGSCKSTTNNLVFSEARQIDKNIYSADIEYNCTIRTTTKNVQTLDILQFIASTRFYIKSSVDKTSLRFQVQHAQVRELKFTPVNGFNITNKDLALFKANQVIQKNIKHTVFGDGFPSLYREVPKNQVEKDWVIYYDEYQGQML